MRWIPPEQLARKPVRRRYLPVHKLPRGQREAVLQHFRYQEDREKHTLMTYEAGVNLEKVKREKIYEKLGLTCFDAYCQSVFGFSAKTANDYIRVGKGLAGYARRGQLAGKVFGIEHMKLIVRTESPYQELMIEHGSGLSKGVLRMARAAGLACDEDTERGERAVLQILQDPKNAKKALAALLAELSEEEEEPEDLSPPATAEEQAEAAEKLLGSLIKLLDGGELDRSRLAELEEERRRQLLRWTLAGRETLDRLIARLEGRNLTREGPAGPVTEEESAGGLVKPPAGQPAENGPDKAGQPAKNEPDKAGQPAENGPDKAGQPAKNEPDKAGQPASDPPDPDDQDPDDQDPDDQDPDDQDPDDQGPAGQPATQNKEPPLTPIVLPDQMLAFVQQVGRAIRERVEPCYQDVWQRKVFDALRGHTGLWEPDHLLGHWERFTNPDLPDLGLDPALWERYCAAVLGDDYRLRFAHLLPAMLAADLPDCTLHLHLLDYAQMPDDMAGMIIEAANRRLLLEPDPALAALAAESELNAEVVGVIEDMRLVKSLVDDLKIAMDKGWYPMPPPAVCRRVMIEAVQAENEALALARAWQIPLPRPKP